MLHRVQIILLFYCELKQQELIWLPNFAGLVFHQSPKQEIV